MEVLLIGVVIGLFVGWHVPQPGWIRGLTGWLRAKLKKDDDTTTTTTE